MRNNTTNQRPATDKQVAFARKLTGERDVPVAGKSSEEAQLIARHEDILGGHKFVSTREASAVIDWLLSLPRLPDPDQPDPGVYVLESGTIVLAKPNRQKSNVYTSRWVEAPSDRLNEDDEFVRGEWSYDPALKGQLGSARRMTLDEAKAFLLRFGRCVRCNRRLKVGQSVERGLGPVCVKEFSLV
jgi:hypothetical protein